MLIQFIGYGLHRDIILLLRFLALIVILFMAYQVIKKIKDTSIFSTTSGFAIFLITQALFHFFIALPDLSYEVVPSFIYYAIINIIFLIGMFSFIFFTELDHFLHHLNQDTKKFSFPLSLFTLVGGILIGILSFFQIISIIFLFLFIVIPTIIATKMFLDPYKNFEIIKRSKVRELFFTGLSLAGLSNFLIINLFFSEFGYWTTYLLNTLLIILGGLLMTWTWSKLPGLSELEWMLKLERIFIIHLESSKLMFHYDFQVLNEKESIVPIEGDLVSSVIGGINIILREVLASNGNIKEINHGNKKILFSHGTATACVLITTGHSGEFEYRLKMFHLSFEKQFGGDALNQWKGDLKIFDRAVSLINKFFS
ncbi:MAG: hypothetical protein EU532_00405 [Promethearchaeota archaeon]|nr:MAG: hypothetical protein EU532_00405 [Candidatus Lokiarchaeota archaeon]